ncbi:hypothetical protein ATANTOWER_024534 [Ataeniobius toweri]|uniref:TNFR-Cys domain-containing protein n=1 Tax=Ataeniobius toweri TaxID=208326 RepID=A0ABU7CKS2_9TELE|nr:hypothetical protein [Ataeniobius toweri]
MWSMLIILGESDCLRGTKLKLASSQEDKPDHDDVEHYCPTFHSVSPSLLCFLVGFALIESGSHCGPKEYRTSDGQCCPMCHEGTRTTRKTETVEPFCVSKSN